MKLQPGDYVSTEGMTEEEYHAVRKALIDNGADASGNVYDPIWPIIGWDSRDNRLYGTRRTEAALVHAGRFKRKLTKDQILGAQKMTKVTVFGQEEARKEEKKAIELIYYIDTDAGKVRTINTESDYFDNVCFLGKERHCVDYDLIMAWNDSNPAEKAIYLGHWNDGVV